jgi:predicted ATPase
MGEAMLQQALDRLVEAELLYRRGLSSQASYLFKHALIQEAAYQSLLKHTRQHYHERIAQVLDERFPEIVETQPELLAHHYTEAGQPAQALPYWLRAGQRASERSANLEAVSQLCAGLAALQTLPATPARAQQELTLQLALGAPLMMIKGHSAPEVEQTYTRALELCQQAGDSPQLFSTLTGLWRFYYARGRLETTRELAEQCFALAQRMQDQALLQEAHMMLGLALFTRGELVSARQHLEQGIALYDPQHPRSLAFSGGTDPGVCCLCGEAWTLWTLGYPERALVSSQEALNLAKRLSHAYSLGFALHYDAMLHKWRREAQLVQERAETVMALSSEHGFARWLAGGMIRQGWALVVQGSAAEGIALLSQGLATWRHMGGELGLPNILGILAEAYGTGGRAEEGLRVLAEALATAHKNTERHYEAELYRLTGELLLQQAGESPPPASDTPHPTEASVEAAQTVALWTEAESCFLQALEVARHQQAKSFELRAAQSLSRLWQQQGKRAEARQLLAEIYGWFSEGFDTPDLQEAKSLLDALA